MTPFGDMISCTPTTAISTATSLMLIKRVGSLLVADKNVYFGYVTKNDLLEAYNLQMNPTRTTLADIMKKHNQTVFAGEFDKIEKVIE